MSVYTLLKTVASSLRGDKDIILARDSVVERINHELSRRGVRAVASGGGSVAKGTHLALDHDIDIFVRFSFDYADLEEQLPDLLEPSLKPFAPVRVHGSRDYFQFTHDGYEFEVIPVLAVSHHSQAQNVTDMSPVHVEYFLARAQGLQDEVRLAKQFCKAQGVYGAESYIRGFSGHVLDILIVHYRSFYALIAAAASWTPPVIIDVEGHHEDPLGVLNEAKLSPLILIDPVQPDRNAAAALSSEQFDAFVSAAKQFLQAPSEAFFVVKEFRAHQVKERLLEHAGSGVWIDMEVFDLKKDVGGARVRKVFSRVVREVSRAGFTVVEDGWHFDFPLAHAWVCVEQEALSEVYEREGPPVSVAEDAERFRAAHDEVFERDGRLWARVSREQTTLLEVVRSLCESLSSEKLTCSVSALDATAPVKE